MSDIKNINGTGDTSPTGDLVARIATLGVRDLDGDVLVKGLVPPGGTPVILGAWNHRSMADAMPIGVATVREEGDALIVRGRLLMDTQAGREHHSLLRALGGAGEWSFAFSVLHATAGMFTDGKMARFLRKLDVVEASPVVRGAAGPGRTGLVELHGSSTFSLAVERAAAVNRYYMAANRGFARRPPVSRQVALAVATARSLGVRV